MSCSRDETFPSLPIGRNSSDRVVAGMMMSISDENVSYVQNPVASGSKSHAMGSSHRKCLIEPRRAQRLRSHTTFFGNFEHKGRSNHARKKHRQAILE
jgi:hypothetical protein